ncbi:FAD/NAD(P)-binding protein [Mycobacterium sp. CBMA271]|uniref:FAD/NAD(P)-binding protein n=1 Tax=unclassified Mycobacteroides TaxID=2618759 RepID=UPI0012DF3C14|nr:MULTISPECIES: FAD/NAD(P)-binding protein [unclassified Mycobacteroides]MUM19371.1 FAD-binding protein [Mycobacteroides sp. CBMA 326]MUM23599.1 FAD/NAD(P)-binding protein [Mycobacteroides sp. CBMA 271]
MPDHQICIIGAGPRGLAVLERLCANERHAPSADRVVVHVVDPYSPGAGSVWRTDQSWHLLMNTVASQITVFTDDSVAIEGPIEPGPTLFEWAQSLALLGDPSRSGEKAIKEARALRSNSYPTRALYGHYLSDSFARVVGWAPDHMTVHVHRSRAVALADTHGDIDGPQGVRLENGTRLHDLSAVILAVGHVPAGLRPGEARAASLARIHGLTYVTPANPADIDLSAIKPGEPVAVRGLGLNFFDYMALLTVGRGGRFEREEQRLVYRPSGQEPVLHASSRRGIPYHARGENQKGSSGRYLPRLLTVERIARLRETLGGLLQFRRDLWPLIAREVECVYYERHLAQRGAGTIEFSEQYLHADEGKLPAVLAEHDLLDVAWDWDDLDRPWGDREFAGPADFTAWILEHLRADVVMAREGNVDGPVKAALDVLRDLRNEIRLAVDHGGLDGKSYREELEGWYTPLNAYLSIGPPAQRIEEMIALIEAGVLHLVGPRMQVRFDTHDPAVVVESSLIAGSAIRTGSLIEARLHEPDLRRSSDPLLIFLLETGQCRPYEIPADGHNAYQTKGLAVTERPYRMIGADGRVHPRRFAYGVPTESVHWVTAAGIRPGVDSVTLGDADAIARAALASAPHPVEDVGEPGVLV